MNAAPHKPLLALAHALMTAAGLFLAFPTQAEEPLRLKVSSYSVAETGTDMSVWTPLQGPDGILHFGITGLLSFDGTHWQISPMGDGYAARGLAWGEDGRIWTAANRNLGWFARGESPTWQFHSLRDKLPFPIDQLGEMWHVFAESSGALFVSEYQVLRWNGREFKVWSWDPAERRRLHAFNLDGQVFVQHPPTGLYVVESTGPRLLVPAADLGTLGIFWLERRGDQWFFVNSRGLFTLSPGEKAEPFGAQATEFLQREALTCVAKFPNGELALGSNHGIAIVRPDGSVRRVLTEADGLPTANVYTLFIDREGSLWGTSPSSYIFRIPMEQPTVFFDERFGLPAKPVMRIAKHGDQIEVSGENGLFQSAASEWSFHPVPTLRERLWDLRSTPDGLLIARNRAVELLNADAAKIIYRTPNAAVVAKPARSMPGTTLISLRREIVAVDADGKDRILVEKLPEPANSIAEDRQGRLWLSTFSTGIFLVKPEASGPAKAVPLSSLPSAPALSGAGLVVATPSGTILICAPEGGWRLDPKTDRFLPIENYPAREISAYSIAALDADENVWVIHPESGGLAPTTARIALRGEHAVWQPHSVPGLWEVGAPKCLLAETTPSGGTALWVGGAKGLLRHEVPSTGPSAPPPAVPAWRAYARSADTSTLHSIVGALPYSTAAVRLELAAPQFSMRPALRLQTFIEGLDREWTTADSTGVRELTGIRDGKYVVRVRTVAETGRASETAVFDFQILPPWWRTMPAIVGVLVALVPGTYALLRLRLRALRRHNQDLEEKVKQRTAQLAKASAAKTEFVANMSHDIRNPLNGIVGLALALEDTPLEARQREIVSTLRECTTYLSSLVDDVLDFASIEAGQVELKAGPFAPAELLRSVATTLKSEAAEQGARLLIETDPNLPPTLLGDAGRIQQILVNYASNALKYAGGTIRLCAKLSPDSRDEIEFAVHDQGPGITAADQATLFTKFNRLKNARGEMIKGTGLGLAACRSLADIMGGSVGVESQPDVGSTFYLRLPIVVSQPPVETPGFSLPAATVLIVEDADYNAWAATAVLAKLGLPCERARDGQEAIELFTRKRFDVVLLDRNLPDMDGTEVAKRIREIEADSPRAILLAVTAYCTAEDRALCLASGMDAFLGKPLTPEKLRKVLLEAGRRLLTAASVHVSPDATVTTLDLTLLSYLSDGTDQGLAEQIERYLATLAQGENQLEHASSARDFAALAGAAHSLLSQAKMVGGTALESAAVALETAARAEDLAAFGALLEPIRREIRALTEAMRRRRPATPVG